MRGISRILTGKPTMEGAGVRLNRVFGYNEVPQFDPFLMMDDFGSTDPADYMPGFPWHPHRGIETVTYLIEGIVEHGDSIGNKGTIGPGDAQWMTAGGGIIHQEMPQESPTGRLRGIQLWVNLPRSEKMCKPRYQDIPSGSIPEVVEGGVRVRVVTGDYHGTVGPVTGVATNPTYLDVHLSASSSFEYSVGPEDTVVLYFLDGSAEISGTTVESGQCALLDNGDPLVRVDSVRGCRFIFISGASLNEPIAWGGPIVMNTREEVSKAFEEYRNGTFVKR